MIRADLYRDRKDIHIKLDKGIHAELRTRMFHCGLTMQDAFEEFARLIGIGDASAMKMLEQLARRKVAEMSASPLKQRPRRKQQRVGEHDHDALYDLITETGLERNDHEEAAR